MEWLQRSSCFVRQSCDSHRDHCMRQHPRQRFTQLNPVPISLSQSRAFSIIARHRTTKISPAVKNNAHQTRHASSSQKTTTKRDGPKPEELPLGAVKNIAQQIRNIAPSFTETYVAYGSCEILVKECARVADYNIPQAKEKNGEIPKNEKGEDVGVGDSWWYRREFSITFG